MHIREYKRISDNIAK